MIKSILALIGIITVLVWILGAKPADCSYCGNLMCLDSSNCFDGCACAMEISDATGICVSVQ